jgi:short subunit dehydrogenase-like uncharacterized protein
MATVNYEIVRWSHALRSEGCESLVYRETAITPDFKTAFVTNLGFVMLVSMFLNPLTLSLVKRFVIPQPGDGPGIEAMEKEHYLCIGGEGVGEKGNTVESFMYFPKDPGCIETVRMMIEAGLCMALEDAKLPQKNGGFWTPSTALGDVLMKRLLDTGMTFEARVVPTKK